VQNKVAPFISTSYGFCEGGETGQTGVGKAFAQQVQGWAQQANSQGQTIVSASGDNGAADCDGVVTSATQGLAVDVPASIPEVTGMGGNTFTGDSTTNTAPGGNPPYWGAATATADLVSSALEYIPEDAWNDTGTGDLAASGGGASLFFSKPTWQTGTGVPADGARDVPDLSFAASPNHDGYLICSEDGGTTGGLQSSCSSAFRDNTGHYTVVGGTSVAAPTFSAILALINQQAGSPGLGNVNPTLYGFAASNPSVFHDVTVGNNKVACTSGTVNCPAGTTQIGFMAGTGYDQVTGLGSVDVNKLATAWVATIAPFTLVPTSTSFPVVAGAAVDATVNVTLNSTFTGTIAFSCAGPSNLVQATCTASPSSINASGPVSFNIATTSGTPVGAYTITVTGTSGSSTVSTTFALSVTSTNPQFSLKPTVTSFQVAQGSSVDATVNVALNTGFTGTVTFLCAEPSTLTESSCSVPLPVNTSGSVSFHITTSLPTASLQPYERSRGIFYAALFPGLFGIIIAAGSRRSRRNMRLLGLFMVLGLATFGLGSCGGASSTNSNTSTPGTPKGTYTITVSGTSSGAPTVTTSFSLVVQ